MQITSYGKNILILNLMYPWGYMYPSLGTPDLRRHKNNNYSTETTIDCYSKSPYSCLFIERKSKHNTV